MNFRVPVACIAAMAILAVTPLRAADVTVFAAASLTDALEAVATNYEENSEDTIILNFGASSMLARQIEEGAPADIFFSADESKMDALQREHLIDPTTRKSRLGNALVVVVAVDSPLKIASADALTNAVVRRLALADPRAVPAGIYAKEWLERVGLWSAVEPKVVPTANVRAALAAVESGNVEAGVVYKTDAGISSKVRIAYTVPAGNAPKISYPVALVNKSRPTDAARRFLKYLSSEEAGQVFKRFGFILPE